MINLLSRTSLEIFGLEISIYGLLIAVGFVLSLFITVQYCKRKNYNTEIPFDLLLWIFPFSIIGARLYYVIFSGYAWSFLEIIQIWEGGLAIYGGIIGGFLGILCYSIIKKENLLKLIDMVAPAVIISQSIGRIGCYFAGCCYGEVVTNSLFQWFPLSVEINGVWHYSTFFYESLWCFMGFWVLNYLFLKTDKLGFTSGAYFVVYGLGRFLIEGIRGDSLMIFNIIRVSQALSFLLVILGIVLIVYSFRKNKTSKND